MQVDDFKNLIEAQGLDQLIFSHRQKITYHTQRITHIKDLQTSKLKWLDENKDKSRQLQSEISKNENKLQDISTRIDKAVQNQDLLTNEQQVKANEAQVNSLNLQKEQLEDTTLDLIDKQERWERDIAEAKEFISGSQKSYAAVESEVNNDVDNEKKKIKALEERIEILLANTDREGQTQFSEINQRYRFKSPLAFIEKGACNKCFIQINRNDINKIETMSALFLCPSCQRILVPQSARA